MGKFRTASSWQKAGAALEVNQDGPIPASSSCEALRRVLTEGGGLHDEEKRSLNPLRPLSEPVECPASGGQGIPLQNDVDTGPGEPSGDMLEDGDSELEEGSSETLGFEEGESEEDDDASNPTVNDMMSTSEAHMGEGDPVDDNNSL